MTGYTGPPPPPPASPIRVSTPVPPHVPCPQYEGEIFVDTAGNYVGDMSGPYNEVTKSGFTSGEKNPRGDGRSCCGGVFWFHSAYWEAPYLLPGCGAGTNFVPVDNAWRGVLYPTLGYDTQGPPGMRDLLTYHFVGSGGGEGDIAFTRPVAGGAPGDGLFLTDFWHPPVGSRWVWQGWVRADSPPSMVGTQLAVGWANTVGSTWTLPAIGPNHVWQFFRQVFTVDARFGSAAAALPQLPALRLYGPPMVHQETETRWWPTTAGGCEPAGGYAAEHTLTKFAPHGGFYLTCLHLYPYVPEKVTVNRRYGLDT